MIDRPASTYTYPVLALVACGIVLTGVLALLVQRAGDPAPAATPAATAGTPGASSTARATGAPLQLPFGPAKPSRMATPVPVSHLTGGANAAAVLALPGGSPASAALHWLDGGGVPTVVAQTIDEALGHPVVVVLGPVADGDVARLQAFVSGGGVLVLERPASPSLLALSGVATPSDGPRDTLVVLPGAGLEAATVRFPTADTTSWATDSGALARYPEGGTAIAARQVGRGVVVALGVALRDAVLASEANVVAPRVPAAGEPSVGTALGRDVLANLGRTVYGLAAPGIALGGAPDGHAAALVLTHDVDTPEALAAAGGLAAIERDRGVRATFFVTAQTRAAAGSPAVLDTAGARTLTALVDAGADVQSGGVAFPLDAAVPTGDGREAVPGYAPTLESGGASLLGEARVSRHVLNAVLPGLDPVAFRAPATVAPPELDGVLAGTGYAVDASPRADVVAGGLPYRLATGDAADAEQPVLRLPLRFDDRRGVTPDRRGAELEAILASAIQTGAPAVVRISPAFGSAATYALQTLLARASDEVWVGAVDDFARFWSARSSLSLDVRAMTGGFRARLTGSGDVPGQTLVLPFRAQRAVLAGDTKPLPLSADGRRIAVPGFTDETEVEIAVATEATAAADDAVTAG